MIGALKTIGTVLTVASTAQFGKEMYDKYKGKKKEKKLDEVHTFIKALDLDELQRAIQTNDTDKLIDAVEDIIKAADTVKYKSDLEELAEDVQEVAGNIFNKLSDVANKVVEKIQDEDNTTNDNSQIHNPSYKEFKKEKQPLQVVDRNGKIHTILIDMDNVFTNNKTKTVSFIKSSDEVITTTLM